jgi:hypothetical protein
MTVLNLDQLAAQHAQKMVSNTIQKNDRYDKILERLVTKTLGVLQSQGVYAMMLFLFSRSGDEKNVAQEIRQEFYSIIKQLPPLSNIQVPDDSDEKKVLKFYSSDDVLGKLDTLLLIRDIFEQTLIYARYGAKAISKG